MGELNLIQKFRAGAPTHPWLIVGPGHDCAVLRWPGDRDQAYKIDQVVEGTHFVLGGVAPASVPAGNVVCATSAGTTAATPKQVGWKAMAKACSDIAAVGFWPVAATVAVNLRAGSDERLALELYDGLCDCCRRFGFGLAGGDVAVSTQGLSVAVSLVGEGPKDGAWLRSGAKDGDALLVTGTLGGSLRTGKHLDFVPRLEEARQIRKIAPNGVHACIDITDGLSRDLHHICDESGCGAAVFEQQLPRADILGNPASTEDILCNGEDFELLLAVAPNAADKLLAQWGAPVQLTKIGTIEPLRNGCTLISADGSRRPMPNVGYEHRT
ncbi:MAG TPA: thiamine-phosphate kinase [Planctomycetota bacterium]